MNPSEIDIMLRHKRAEHERAVKRLQSLRAASATGPAPHQGRPGRLIGNLVALTDRAFVRRQKELR